MAETEEVVDLEDEGEENAERMEEDHQDRLKGWDEEMMMRENLNFCTGVLLFVVGCQTM